ncbi:MAG: hypothetical protein KGI87_07110, partial [Burkholderiales bacterium]|nr:hypothetical protein [Burkholderiales bacterium]
MGPEPISGAVVKLSGDLLAKLSSGDSAGLIPRLVVHGTGTGVVWGFNLHIQNAGKEAAYGLQLSVPWDVLQRNRSRESHMTEWWAQTQSPPYVGLRWLAEKLRIRPLAQWASVRGLMFTTKDVGLVLAPGESVEVYFGMAPTSGRSGPVDGIVWKPGEIVE